MLLPVLLGTALAFAPSAPPCLPATVDLSTRMPFHPTASQWRELVKGLSSPSAVALRRDLDAYQVAKADRETMASLRPFGARKLKGPFALLSEAGGMFGGTFLEVEFTESRDAVYVAWMYHYGDGTWVVRKLTKTACGKDQLRWINVRYAEVLRFSEDYDPK